MKRAALRNKCRACKKALDNGNGGPGHPMRKVRCILCRRNFCISCVEFLGKDAMTAKKEIGIGLCCKTCRAELALTTEPVTQGRRDRPHIFLGPVRTVTLGPDGMGR